MTTQLEQILQQIAGFHTAAQAVQQQALSRRAALIEQVRQHGETAQRAEWELCPAASTINAKVSKLREQLAALERELSENLSAQTSARNSADAAIRDLQCQLRSEVLEQVTNLQARIVQTRDLLHSNFGNARPWILGASNERPHSDAQVVTALALLLDEHKALDRIAVEEADFQAAIAALPDRLAKAGIQLVDSKTLLHLVPPLQKAQAYI